MRVLYHRNQSKVMARRPPLPIMLGACRRRVWLIVAFVVGFAGVAAVWSFIQTPLYQAKATVVVEQVGTERSGKGPGLPSGRPCPGILPDSV